MRAANSKAEIESEVASRFATAFKLQEKPPVGRISTRGSRKSTRLQEDFLAVRLQKFLDLHPPVVPAS